MDERVKCSVCEGLKCACLTSRYYSDDKKICYNLCRRYTFENILCGFRGCGRKCPRCGGIGNISWIDNLFLENIKSHRNISWLKWDLKLIKYGVIRRKLYIFQGDFMVPKNEVRQKLLKMLK